jgi:[ribosomal protein S5]-alanine N-acetyltransferase
MQPAHTYFLKTPRLGFRPWSWADFPLAMALWGDPNVTRFLGGPFSEKDVAERLRREIDFDRVHHLQYWPMFFLPDGGFVGCCGLRPYKIAERVFELGFHLRPAYWGTGLAVEAGHAVISHAFGVLGASGLFAGHDPVNAASRRVLEKLGFQYTHDEIYAPTGEMHPSYALKSPR